ncbi:ATP phosphoribosyltransferase regulatory subunit [Helicobacter sp.]|uniref:ATP phosphoribosyltransferase regulatory subunit n=1 Tax=Helicobacter sp. TaxID=218 RepID=UPI0025BD27D4|nr:ATP phosphoribosyltransferase regulatory subunit [Helicobacter sp.]MCI5968358.1 ATP phosphoribosyltransferase regulatory subunit [Helicobacter sp.]MDY2584833.1 ATP phosphoribosyltransferase regulatory subunit [Helicobacter sp.]
MILSHEIPQGCKLYFGKSAQLKREIEAFASAILQKNGYQEIITPTFAYLEHQRDIKSREVVRTNNQYNHQIALRNDSTIDTIRLLAPHLRENTKNKRWFYIQPIFIYPTTEIHQIGVENLENCNIAPFITMSLEILDSNFLANTPLKPHLQLANVRIPQICAEIFKIPLIAFKNIDVEAITKANPIMQELLCVHNQQSLQEFLQRNSTLERNLKYALEQLLGLAKEIPYANCTISPLYCAPMHYYTGLFFRFFAENSTLILGGEYTILEQNACGFGIYTDDFIQYLLRSDG